MTRVQTVVGTSLIAIAFLGGAAVGGRLVYKYKPNHIAMQLNPTVGTEPTPYVHKNDTITWYKGKNYEDVQFSTPTCKKRDGTLTDTSTNGACKIGVSIGTHFYSCTDCGDPTLPNGTRTGPPQKIMYGQQVYGFLSELLNLDQTTDEASEVIPPFAPESALGSPANVYENIECSNNKLIPGNWLPKNVPFSDNLAVKWGSDGSFTGLKIGDSGDGTFTTVCKDSLLQDGNSTSCTLKGYSTLTKPLTYTISADSCGSPIPGTLPPGRVATP